MTVTKKIGLRLREIRLQKKITQESLAKNSGIERTFISHIERGGRNISIETLSKLLSPMNISFKKFFSHKHFV